jgi:hypothetical protein
MLKISSIGSSDKAQIIQEFVRNFFHDFLLKW